MASTMTLSAYVQDDQKLSEQVIWVEITKDESGVLLTSYNVEESPITKTRHRNTEAAKQYARDFGIGEEHWFEV